MNSDLAGTLVLMFLMVCFVFGVNRCGDEKHKQHIETRQQCFDATKNINCFGELK